MPQCLFDHPISTLCTKLLDYSGVFIYRILHQTHWLRTITTCTQSLIRCWCCVEFSLTTLMCLLPWLDTEQESGFWGEFCIFYETLTDFSTITLSASRQACNWRGANKATNKYWSVKIYFPSADLHLFGLWSIQNWACWAGSHSGLVLDKIMLSQTCSSVSHTCEEGGFTLPTLLVYKTGAMLLWALSSKMFLEPLWTSIEA